jgi:hypothetical protein
LPGGFFARYVVEDARQKADMGYRFGAMNLTINSNIDNSYKGIAALDFAPATRLDYAVAKQWAIAP